MSKRDAALKLAQKGFKVFLLGLDSKIPAIPVVIDKAINDPSRVAAMWTSPFGEPRDENVGVNTDELFILDFDPKAGRELMDLEFETYCKAYKFKHVVLTQSEGYHVYYRLPPGVRCASTSKGSKKFGETIDSKSWHSYVVGPGSDIDGAGYRWIESVPDGHCIPNSIMDLDVCPQEFLDACGQPAERAAQELNIDWDEPAALSRAKEYLLHHAPEAKQGEGGDDITYKVACRIRDFGVSQDTAFDLLSDHWNQTKAHPPWAPDELERKVENAYRYAKGVPHAPGSEYDPVDLIKPDAKIPTASQPKRESKIQQESFDEACDNAITLMGKPLVKGLVNCNTLLALYGATNAGKSFIAIELGRCIAMGEPFAGRKTEKGAVLYFGLEAPQGLRRRFRAVRKHKAGGASIPMVFCSGRINLFNGEADVTMIVEEIKTVESKYGIGVKLIILDTLTKAAPGAEQNGDRDMGLIMSRAEAIKDTAGVCVGIVHHAGKNLAKGMRGSTVIPDSVDTALSIEADPRKPGESATGNIVVAKQRDLDFVSDIPFALDQKDVWVDPETLEVHHSCVVEFPPENTKTVSQRPTSRVQLCAWAAFELAEKKCGVGAWISVAALHEAEIERAKIEGEGPPKRPLTKPAIKSRMKTLTAIQGLESRGENWRRPVGQHA